MRTVSISFKRSCLSIVSEGNYSLKEMRTVPVLSSYNIGVAVSEGNYSLKEMRTSGCSVPHICHLVGRKETTL